MATLVFFISDYILKFSFANFFRQISHGFKTSDFRKLFQQKNQKINRQKKENRLRKNLVIRLRDNLKQDIDSINETKKQLQDTPEDGTGTERAG